VCPALLDEELVERARHTALRAFRALGCRDWCRIDMRLAADGRLHVLELNPIAGLDPSYLLPRAAAAGSSYPRLINAILDACLARVDTPRRVKGRS
jgi:D-alanine-D-alanine ligase